MVREKMKSRKSKPNEPSLRDKLSQDYLRAFQDDFEENGVAVIKALREKSPEKYAEIAARLIAATEPQSDSFRSAKSQEEIARRLLISAGCSEFEITDEMIADTIKANDTFVGRLDEIAAAAIQRQNGLN